MFSFDDGVDDDDHDHEKEGEDEDEDDDQACDDEEDCYHYGFQHHYCFFISVISSFVIIVATTKDPNSRKGE